VGINHSHSQDEDNEDNRIVQLWTPDVVLFRVVPYSAISNSPCIQGSASLSKDSLHANRASIEGETSLTVRPHGELADVQAERDRVERMTDFSSTPILVRNIKKIYPGQDGGKPKVRRKVKDHEKESG
jgi:hypothetical protein